MVYVHTMETPADAIDKGKMRINVYDKQQGTPLADARISLAYTGNPERIINEITTDSEGAVNLDDLLTPPVEYSMEQVRTSHFRNTLLMLMQMATRRLIYPVLMYSQGKQVFRMCI